MLALLRHIRDTSPTEEQLLEWLGASDHGSYHKLPKAGLTVVENGRVKLSSNHLSADGKSFLHGVRLYWLDKDQIDHLFISPDGQERRFQRPPSKTSHESPMRNASSLGKRDSSPKRHPFQERSSCCSKTLERGLRNTEWVIPHTSSVILLRSCP
jgi:hypothetical protein